MTRRGLLVALAVVVAVNAGVLVGVARNRGGQPDATITIDERELTLTRQPGDDSTIRLRWNIPREARPGEAGPSFLQPWIDQPKLEALGFDCSVRPGDLGAETFYRSVLPRSGFVVLEYAGPSWRDHVARWQERARADLERRRASGTLGPGEDARYEREIETALDRVSRLLPIDVGLDPDALRARYADRSQYLLLQAVVRLNREPGTSGTPPALVGRIVEWLPFELAVPRAGRAAVSGLTPTMGRTTENLGQPQPAGRFSSVTLDHDPRYRVVVKVGHLLQPWVEQVVPTPSAAAPMQHSGR